MNLREIFNDDYYDEIQHQLKARQPKRETSATTIQDFIISSFEAGDISYDEALAKLKEATPEDQLFFWEHELGMAEELKKD